MKNFYKYLHLVLIGILLFGMASFSMAQNAWINEIHYDNYGTDEGEFIEVVIENPSNYILSDFEVYLYNGNNGSAYDVKSLNQFTVGSTVDDFTFYYFDYPENGIQNGSPDGIALVYQAEVVSGQFLSYEGTLTAADGPAAGMTSTDIGVEEPGEVGESLQLSGAGTSYADFEWNPPASETKGNLNNGQTFGAPAPEPTNYPTGFTATASRLSIDLSWTDAVGTQLPHAYLVLGSSDGSFMTPLDGFPREDDADLSDGTATLNIDFGVEECSFNNLLPNQEYFFVIYPYTNAASNIDYKTDGTVPEATTTTANILILNSEDFNDTTLGTWTQISVIGDDQFWLAQEEYGIDNSPNAVMDGYDGGNIENEDWLISPELFLPTDVYNPTLEFWNAKNYNGNDIEVKISTDYTGSGDPNSATWNDLEVILSPGDWEWTYSGLIALTEFVSFQSFYIAFKYTSTSTASATWEIDNILISAESTVGLLEVAKNTNYRVYPNPASDYIRLISGDDLNEIRIMDLSGKVIEHVQFTGSLLDISHLYPGVYFIQPIDGKHSYLPQKLIVR